MLRIVIDNEDLNINRDTKLTFNSNIFSLQNGSARGYLISNQIKITDTRVNRRLLDNPNVIHENKTLFSKIYTCKIIDSYLNIRGSLRLLYYEKDKGGTIILGSDFTESVLFFQNSIRSTLLSTIDSYDFLFNLDSYNSLKELSSNIWLFRVTQNTETVVSGEPATENDLAPYRPCFRIKSLIDKISEVAKINFIVDENKISEYSRLALTSYHNNFILSNYEKEYNEGAIQVPIGENIINDLDINRYQVQGVTTTATNIKVATGLEVGIVLRAENIQVNGTVNFIVRSSNFEYKQQLTNDFVYINTGYLEPLNGGQRTIEMYFQSDKGGNFTYTNLRIYTIIQDKSLTGFDPKNYYVKTYENLEYKGNELLNILFGLFYSTLNFNFNDNTITLTTLNDIVNKKEIEIRELQEKEKTENYIITNEVVLSYKNDSFLGDTGSHNFFTKGTTYGVSTFIELQYSGSLEVNSIARNELFLNSERKTITRRLLYARDSSPSFAFYHMGFNEISFNKLQLKYFTKIKRALTNPMIKNMTIKLFDYEFMEITKGNLIKSLTKSSGYSLLPLSIKNKSNDLYEVTALIIY